MPLRRLCVTVLLLALWIVPTPAQDSLENLLDLTVSAGYADAYRPDDWLPVRVTVRNAGESFNGRITVRPETSGRVVTNAYSTPIDLPRGSEKTAFLYIQAQRTTTPIVVEVLNSAGNRMAQQSVRLRPLQTVDVLHVVVSDDSANSIPLGAVRPGGYQAQEVRWTVEQLPPAFPALRAIDTLIFYDVQSDRLTVPQREAIGLWVAQGGQLIVVGGPDWQETAAAFDALLPVVPQDSQTTDNLDALADFVGRAGGDLDTRTLATTVTVIEAGRALVRNSDDLPLIVRRDYGAGVVDYLTLDPTLEPLRSWDGLSEMWYTLVTNRGTRPGWTRGIVATDEVARSLAILPGINLLPSVWSMIAYIGAYILLIGPVNYLILSRLQRPAWAWVTIPLLIGAFSFVAWSFGFNLRGSDIIVSRLNMVQSFPDHPTAMQEQAVGLLSPRRETYTMDIPDDQFVQVLPGLAQNNLLQSNISVRSAEIVQGERFTVENIAVDGGIFGNFGMIGAVEKPAVSGRVTFTYQPDTVDAEAGDIEVGGQSVLGSIRNDSDITLMDPVIVVRNRYARLGAPIAPGDVVNFNDDDLQTLFINDDDIRPSVSTFDALYDLTPTALSNNIFSLSASLITPRLLIGQDASIVRRSRRLDTETEDLDEEGVRRFAFLRGMARDQFSSQNIGHDAYLFGWTNSIDRDLVIDGTTYQPVDTALHIVQLETTVEPAPAGEMVTITPDSFTWSIRDRQSTDGFFNNLRLINPGSVDIRFTPLPGAVLETVESLYIEIDRSTSSAGREVDVLLYNWEAQMWEAVEFDALDFHTIDDAARFVGPRNIVDMRLDLDSDIQSFTATANLRIIRLSQRGQF